MIFLYLNSTSKNENTEALYYHMTVLELILVYYMFMEFRTLLLVLKKIVSEHKKYSFIFKY